MYNDELYPNVSNKLQTPTKLSAGGGSWHRAVCHSPLAMRAATSASSRPSRLSTSAGLSSLGMCSNRTRARKATKKADACNARRLMASVADPDYTKALSALMLPMNRSTSLSLRRPGADQAKTLAA